MSIAPPLSLEELDKQNLLHPFSSIEEQQTRGPIVMVRGEGCRIWDNQGNEYIDTLAGLWCVNIGYGREEMAEAIAEQARTLCFYQSFLNMSTAPMIRLAAKVAELAPGDLNKVFFGNSGSDANDTAIKLIWYYNNLMGRPEKKKLIARKSAYHGVTVASSSLTGLPPVHNKFDLPIPGRFLHVDRPHYYWDAEPGMSERDFSEHLARRLEERIIVEGPETIAAFFAEPLMGAGGCVPPPEGYWDLIVPILRKYDILLVSDEVICGFGRLGTWFGCERFGVQPDLISAAKGLTSGYIPMSASIISDKVWNVLRDGSAENGPFSHGYTYSGHAVAAAAGVKNLEIMEREDLVGRVRELEPYLQSQFRACCEDHPLVGQARGIGFVAAAELVKDKANKVPFSGQLAGRFTKVLREEGIIMRPIMNTVVMSPPFVITREEIDQICTRFARGLDRFAKELEAEGTWSRP